MRCKTYLKKIRVLLVVDDENQIDTCCGFCARARWLAAISSAACIDVFVVVPYDAGVGADAGDGDDIGGGGVLA